MEEIGKEGTVRFIWMDDACREVEEMEFRCIDDYRRMFHIYGSLVEGHFRKWFMDDAFLADDNLLYFYQIGIV